MADVRLVLEDLREESTSGVTSSPPPVARSTWWPGAVALVAVLAAAAVGWKLLRPGPEPPPKLMTVTSFAGQEWSPSLSPDGKQVAFAWGGEDQKGPGIFIKLVDTGAPLRLTTGPDAYPAWSPDGRYIAFVRLGREPGYLAIPALGGPERRIAAIPRIPSHATHLSLDWTRDGNQLVIVDTSQPAARLSLVPLEGGVPALLSNPPRESFGDFLPKVSRDGRSVAFLRCTSTNVGELYRADLNGANLGAAQLLYKPSTTNVIDYSWARDSRSIIASDRIQGQVTLFRIPLTGTGPPALIPGAGSNARQPTVALEADRLAFAHFFYDLNVWRMPLDTQGAAAAEQVFASSKVDEQADYSPDGKRIAFVSDRSGGTEIWVAQADGSNPVQLTSNLYRPLRPRWSPDGRRIAFAARPGGNVDIYVVEAAGGPARRLTTHLNEDASAQWSRDGKWVYFASNRTGRRELWKIPTDGSGPEIQITKEGGWVSRESTDGQTLYFVKLEIHGIWRMPAAGGPETKIRDEYPWSNWDIVGNRLYYRDDSRIRSIDLATEKVTDLTAADPRMAGGTTGFSVTPDGKWLLYARQEQAASDILLLDGFR
jgi:Tol biopolymer transport system component